MNDKVLNVIVSKVDYIFCILFRCSRITTLFVLDLAYVIGDIKVLLDDY